MAADSALTSNGTGLNVTFADDATRILASGHLSLAAVNHLDGVLGELPGDETVPVLLRLASTELEFGAGNALRRVLTTRRRLCRQLLAVWADEPLVRRGIPVALLHSSPPHIGGTWDAAVPTPP